MSVTDTQPRDGAEPQAAPSLPQIVERVIAAAGRDEVTLGDLVTAFGRASFTPLLLVPSLAVVTPLSGIPLFSSLCGILIFLVSIQMLLRRRHVWLPRWIMERRVAGKRVRQTFAAMRGPAGWLDRHTHKRLTIFMHRPFIFVPQLVCVLSGLAMPFLELVPFSSSVLGAGVFLLALAMLTRDGLLAAVATLPYLGLGYLVAKVALGG